MKLGFHVREPTPQLLQNIVERINNYKNISAMIQIFITNPQKYTFTKNIDAEIFQNFPIVVHGSYVSNPWSGNTKCINNLNNEIEMAKQINAEGIIVHISAQCHDISGIAKICKKIKHQNITLILENNASKSDPFIRPTEFAEIYKAVAGAGISCMLCIDTAHLWASGFDCSSYESMLTFLRDIVDAGCPADRIMFHMNDSANELGSGKDKHEKIFAGMIWKYYSADEQIFPAEQSSVKAIIDFSLSNNNMIIFERGNNEVWDEVEKILEL